MSIVKGFQRHTCGLRHRVQEAEVETRMMCDEHRVSCVCGELADNVLRPGSIGDHLVGDAVETRRVRGSAARIDQRVECVVRAHHTPVDAYGADRHQPVTGLYVKAGGFAVDHCEHDVGQRGVQPLLA